MKKYSFFFFLLFSIELFSQTENSKNDTISKIFENSDTINTENYLKKQNSIFFDTIPYFNSPLLNSATNNLTLVPQADHELLISMNEKKYQNNHFFSLHQPYTLIQYAVGTGEYQSFHLSHFQRIFKKLNFGGVYNRIKSTGFYQNQKTIWDDLSIQLNSDVSKKYFFKVNYNYGKLTRAENGGVASDSLFESSSVPNPMTLDVNLQEAENQFSFHQADLENNFKIKNSTIYNRLTYRFNYRNYTDDPSVGFYEFILLDSNGTNDRYEINSFESTTGLKLNSGKFLFDFFIANVSSYYKSTTTDTSFFNNSANIRVKFKNKLNLSGAYHLTGYQNNNYLISINYHDKILNKESVLDLSSTLKQKNQEIEWMNLYSNNYQWQLQLNPQFQNHNSVSVKNKFGIFNLLNSNYYNYTYLNSDIIPEQNDDLVGILSFIYKYNYENEKINFKGAVTFQKVVKGEEVYRIPSFIGFLEIGFKMHLKALKIISGINTHYFSSYYGNAFNPALNNFYLQNEKKTGGYPYATIFVKTEVGNVHFKFCVNHANEGLLKTPYYSTLHYPNSPRNYQISLSWLFKD